MEKGIIIRFIAHRIQDGYTYVEKYIDDQLKTLRRKRYHSNKWDTATLVQLDLGIQ